MDYKFLKSGTDVRGFASDLGGKKIELDDKAVYDIAAAFAVWCVNKFEKAPEALKIALGHDSRITAETLEQLNEVYEGGDIVEEFKRLRS